MQESIADPADSQQPLMSRSQLEHYLLQVREIGITEAQMSDVKVLTVLHDNGNVATLASNFYDGERGSFGATVYGFGCIQ